MLEKKYFVDAKSSYTFFKENSEFVLGTFHIHKNLENIIQNHYSEKDIMIDIAKYLIRDIIKNKDINSKHFDFSYNGTTIKNFILIKQTSNDYLILHEMTEKHLKDVGNLYT